MAKKKKEEVAPTKEEEKKPEPKATKKKTTKAAPKKAAPKKAKKAAPKKETKAAPKKAAPKKKAKAAPKKAKKEAPPKEPKEAPPPEPVEEVTEVKPEEELPPPPPPEEEEEPPEPEKEEPVEPEPEVQIPPEEEPKEGEAPEVEPEEERPAEVEAPPKEVEAPEPEPAEEKPAEEKPEEEKAPPKKKEKKLPTREVPLLFSKWDFTEVEVEDQGLRRYINLNPIYIPHTGAKHANKRFGREKVNIVERLINNTMRTERFTGKKSKAFAAVRKAFEIIEQKSKQNPIQVLVHALQNAAPREEITRLRFGGISVPRAVDIAPSRRLDIAMRNICKGAVASTHKNKKPIEACLAGEIMLAAKEDITSFSISRKEELERVAVSAR